MQEWEAYEQRYGPLLVHDRIDIGFATLAAMLSGSGKPLRDFMPTWWDWLYENIDEYEEYEGQPDEAGKMIATMRAMANKWAKKREQEVSDGSERAGSADNRRRDEPEARVHAGGGRDERIRGVYGKRLGGDEASDR